MFSNPKTISRKAGIVTVATLAFAFMSGCKTTPTAPAPAPAQQIPIGPPVNQRSGVFGTAQATPGVNANLGGMRITAHASLDHLRNYVRSGVAQVNGSGLNVSWDMTITPGTYFILAWLDQNNDGYLSYGDVAGIVGEFGLQSGEFTPVQVWENQKTNAGTIRCEVLYGKPAWLEGDITNR